MKRNVQRVPVSVLEAREREMWGVTVERVNEKVNTKFLIATQLQTESSSTPRREEKAKQTGHGTRHVSRACTRVYPDLPALTKLSTQTSPARASPADENAALSPLAAEARRCAH